MSRNLQRVEPALSRVSRAIGYEERPDRGAFQARVQATRACWLAGALARVRGNPPVVPSWWGVRGIGALSRAANLEREQKFVDSVAEFRGFETPAVMIGEDSTSYTNVMHWLTTDGQEVHVEQVAVQRWREGKIVHERFYYDTGS